MVRISFLSKGRKGYAYRIDTGSPHYKSGTVHYDVFEFQTYGDGLIQHSPEYASGIGWTYDFLLSVANHLFYNQGDAQLLSGSFFWPSPIQRSEIKFLAGLKFNPEKVEYYSPSEMKVSRSGSKQWDRRWSTIPTWADGTFSATMRFLVEKRKTSTGIETLLIYNQLREYYGEEFDSWYSLDGFGIDCKEEWHQMHGILRSCECIIRAFDSLETARRILDRTKGGDT